MVDSQALYGFLGEKKNMGAALKWPQSTTIGWALIDQGKYTLGGWMLYIVEIIAPNRHH